MTNHSGNGHSGRLRACGYCRTSGEGQRGNTSIPRQQADIKDFIERNGWEFVEFYIDECKSGSSVEGRDDFQRMLRDAAKGRFDVVVPFDAKRFARDGVDIVSTAKDLKDRYGVFVVDAHSKFDTRSNQHILRNFLEAAIAEDERMSILQRTIGGRVATAAKGKPWCRSRPIGRDYDEAKGKWIVTDMGRELAELLKRYAAGESLTELCREFKISGRAKISQWVWHGQLAGEYKAKFNCPDAGIFDERVLVPGMPEVVSESLLAKVRKRLQHNRIFNRHDTKRYKLSGFIRCENCGRALTGQTQTRLNGNGVAYYRHNGEDGCSLKGVRADVIESFVLDHLYGRFLDEPAFNAAVERAIPSTEHRERLVKERTRKIKELTKIEREIGRLVDAVAKGADVGLLISKQDELKAEQKALTKQIERIETEIAALPDPKEVKERAAVVRQSLLRRHRGKDWRKLDYDEIKLFLRHLFGDSGRESEYGVFVRIEGQSIICCFRGYLECTEEGIADRGKPVQRWAKQMIKPVSSIK